MMVISVRTALLGQMSSGLTSVLRSIRLDLEPFSTLYFAHFVQDRFLTVPKHALLLNCINPLNYNALN